MRKRFVEYILSVHASCEADNKECFMQKKFSKLVVLLTLLAVGSSAQAYHVIKPHRKADKQQVMVERMPGKVEFSATSQGYTDRKLLDEDAPEHVMNRPNPLKQPVSQDSDFGTYFMCPGDKVRINVLGHEELFGGHSSDRKDEMQVRPDGGMMLPLIGDVQMAGKSVEENVREITQRFSEYLVDPRVTLNITQLGTTRVYVFGEIQQQGTFELTKSHNLVDAIGAAHGFSKKSKKKCVYVLRKNQPDFVLKVDMLELFHKNNSSCNPMLREGDVVYVSSNHKFVFTDVFNVVARSVAALADYESFRRNRKLNND